MLMEHMPTDKTIFWEVDTQADFMLPKGKLYVPGAERLLPNIQRLTNAARENKVFLVSHGCYHVPDDPEFSAFPPHCLHATPRLRPRSPSRKRPPHPQQPQRPPP